ncbi:Cofilin/tropomyosin-type actin-binding protein [Carpediemonas membranifera]|uniref:Cofilin/tropomyosin-type actin-binding protein n=1 Tax=Carpediemonas membranifera TaxID=201153 RepID=A0A8J6AQ63_9EUKA|nr:Cofilin/tropomyosin-type actin-binding protein [Carpediemonas membranifera]|eukprot:KAG9390598.1 Cofilin/tropomyosin-type actin-binding protein [Carpediemonas membranifera]
MSFTAQGNIRVEDLDKIKGTINDIRDATKPTQWMTLTYGKGRNDIVMSQTGNGDINELVDALTPDTIYFSYIRVPLDALREKFVFITYIGESVRPMKRAFVSQHKPDIEKILSPHHLSVSASSEEDLAAEEILKSLHKGSGANYDAQASQDKGILPVDPNYLRERKDFYKKQELTEERDLTRAFNKDPLSTTPMDLRGRPGITERYINDNVPKTAAKPAPAPATKPEPVAEPDKPVEPAVEPVEEPAVEEPTPEEPAEEGKEVVEEQPEPEQVEAEVEAEVEAVDVSPEDSPQE